MFDARTVAARHGIVVELADLGEWGAVTLMSEYDPSVPAIRINARTIERYRAACGTRSSCDIRSLIDFAIAHELYHHYEATGEVARLHTRAQREAAADAFARANVALDAHLDAALQLISKV